MDNVTDQDFWLTIRAALIMVVRAIEKHKLKSKPVAFVENSNFAGVVSSDTSTMTIEVIKTQHEANGGLT